MLFETTPMPSLNEMLDALATHTPAPTRITRGIRVRCVDDSGWLIDDPGEPHLTPVKGQIYTVREYDRTGSVGMISLMEGGPEHFYRACRFEPVTG